MENIQGNGAMRGIPAPALRAGLETTATPWLTCAAANLALTAHNAEVFEVCTSVSARRGGAGTTVRLTTTSASFPGCASTAAPVRSRPAARLCLRASSAVIASVVTLENAVQMSQTIVQRPRPRTAVRTERNVVAVSLASSAYAQRVTPETDARQTSMNVRAILACTAPSARTRHRLLESAALYLQILTRVAALLVSGARRAIKT